HGTVDRLHRRGLTRADFERELAATGFQEFSITETHGSTRTPARPSSGPGCLPERPGETQGTRGSSASSPALLLSMQSSSGPPPTSTVQLDATSIEDQGAGDGRDRDQGFACPHRGEARQGE